MLGVTIDVYVVKRCVVVNQPYHTLKQPVRPMLDEHSYEIMVILKQYLFLIVDKMLPYFLMSSVPNYLSCLRQRAVGLG